MAGLEQDRQERMFEFLTRNRVKIRVIGILCVLILALLAAISMPRLVYRHVHTRSDVARGDIWELGKVLDDFKADSGRYPETLSVLLEGQRPSGIPVDPWGNEYIYACPGTHDRDRYDLISCGPDGVAGTKDDITSWDVVKRE